MDSPPENDVCSVCHERFTLPCQANCSHWFCGSCIMRVWHHGSALRPCKCPICRRLITLLIPTETAQRQRHETEASQVLENIEKYNRSFGGGSHSLMQVSKLHWDHAVTFDAASAVMFSSQILCAWSLLGLMWKCQKRLRDLPFFTRRLLREMMDPQRSLPLVFRARMIFAMIPTILYVLSPIDILPEGVFGLIGLLDDLLILLIVFLHLAAIYRSILLYRHGGH